MAEGACHVVGSVTQVGLTQALGNIGNHWRRTMLANKNARNTTKLKVPVSAICLLSAFALSACSGASGQSDESPNYSASNTASICSTMRDIARTVKTNADAGMPLSAQLAAYTTGDAKTDRVTHTIVVAAYTRHVKAESTSEFVSEMDAACRQAF
jgi:hypothetical protein